MLITSITPQKKNKNRVNIFLDDVFAFGLDLEILLKYHLTVNTKINQEQIDKIIKDNEFVKWWNKTLNYLSFRPRTKKEIIDYLEDHETGEQITNMIMDKLITQKLIDDKQFIKLFVDQRQSFRPRGQKLLKFELLRKGISKSDIDNYFIQNPVSNEVGQAYSLIMKKWPIWKTLDQTKKQQKLQGLLLRKGYNWDVVKAVWKRLQKEITI